MGRIIHQFGSLKPTIYIERRIDEIETQKLYFRHDKDSTLGSEGGASLSLFGRDNHDNIIEITIPISAEDLKMALEKYISSK